MALDEQAVEDLEAHADTPHGIADNAFVYTHKTFSVAYNGDQIVAVNLTASEPVKIEAGKAYEFTYSVVDSQGAFATGTVRIAVVGLGQPQPPLAVEDRGLCFERFNQMHGD